MSPSPEQAPAFVSKLSAARERFLAAVVEHALTVGRRAATDFLRVFPPREIMNALGGEPRLRAKLLVGTTGVDERVATKKSAASAGEDLEIALAEGVTNAGVVLSLFDPDDRVRYLDHARLWSFVTEGEFWRSTAEGTPVTIARDHIGFILDRGCAEKLLTDRDVVEGIGVAALVEALPPADIVTLLEKALSEGRAGRAFKDEGVRELVSTAHLLEHVSLAHVWERVVAKKLAFGAAEDANDARVSIELVVDEEEEEDDDEADASSAALEAAAANLGVDAMITRLHTAAGSSPNVLEATTMKPPPDDVSERVTKVSDPPKTPTARPR